MLPSAAKPFVAKTAVSVLDNSHWDLKRHGVGGRHAQTKDLGGISSLDAVALALPRVACNDTEVCACDGENSSSVVAVGVELALLRPVSGGSVLHYPDAFLCSWGEQRLTE